MDSEDEILGLLILAAGLITLQKKSAKWLNRRWWVRPINLKRRDQGDFLHLLQEMKDDPDTFFRYTRMSLPQFTNCY